MTPIPEPAGLLAGFVLAHAVWNVSDLPEGALLVPLAVVEVGSERRLMRFEAENQERAIAEGKSAMRDAMATADAWAFARDGLIDRRGQKVDVLSVDFWATGMAKPATLVQEYQPPARFGRFHLLGDPVLVLEGAAQAPAAASDVLDRVRTGIRSHAKVAGLWDSWR